MGMNSNFQLALRVAGTKQRRAGFAPLVTVGVLAGDEGANMYRSTMVAERPAYVVKHAPTYILYQLIDRGAKPFDAEPSGVLSIALTISSNAQLAEGKSPFTLLDEVYKKFVDTYMESTSDGRLSFIDTDNDNEIFREIVSHYKLEPRRSTYFTMNPLGPTGVVCVPQDKLPDFFINTQYKEFTQFKDVEIGVSCSALVSPGLERLQIPLPPNIYEIWVNGKSTGTAMQFPTDKFLATAGKTKFYSYEDAEFTLGELLDAPMNKISRNGAIISLEIQKNRINCDLKRTDVTYNCVYQWIDNVGGAKEDVISFIKNNQVTLLYGNCNLKETLLGNPHVKASDINGQEIVIRPQSIGSYNLLAFADINENKQQVIVRIVINNRSISTIQNSERSGQTVHVNTHTANKNGLGTDDYFKRAQSQTQPELKSPNKKLDVKSLALGVVIGLVIGLGTWGVFSILNGERTPVPQLGLQADSISDVSELTESTTLSEEEDVNVPVETEAEKHVPSEEEQKLEEAKAEEGAKEKAGLKAEQNAAAKAALADLIRVINSKDLQKCRTHEGWKNLSQQDKIAIEAVLNPDQFRDKVNGQGKKKLEKIKERSFSFNSLSDVKAVQSEISTIITNNPN